MDLGDGGRRIWFYNPENSPATFQVQRQSEDLGSASTLKAYCQKNSKTKGKVDTDSKYSRKHKNK